MTHNSPPFSTRSRSGRRLALPAAAAVGVLGFAVAQTISGSAVAATPIGMFSDTLAPTVAADTDRTPVELGVKFVPQQSGSLSAVQYYQSAKAVGVSRATVWSSTGKALAQVTFPTTTKTGWRTIPLSSPLKLTAGQTYVTSYFAPKGGYPTIENNLTTAKTVPGFQLPAGAGVYKYSSTGGFPTSTYKGTNYLVDVVYTPSTATSTTTSTSSTATSTSTSTVQPTTTTATSTTTVKPTTTSTTSTTTVKPTTTTTTSTPTASASTTTTPPSTQTGWPSSSNTGVPTGTALTPYTGSCTITTANTVIDAKTLNCDLVIRATGVRVTRSHLNGRIVSTSGGSVSVSDSYVDGGQQETFPAVGQENITLTRVEVVGGQHSVQCYSNCTVQDSYLHDQMQPADGGHVNAFISNGGSNFTLTHNTLWCTVRPTSVGGGCTADVSFFGDFGPVSRATVSNNLFKARSDGAGYCTQAGWNPGKAYPDSTYMVYRNNTFERGTNGKCGIWGPVTAFNPNATGNVWSGNVFTDGVAIQP